MYIDATKVDTSTFKPASYWGPQPWSSQFFEETGHCQTDVPGLASAKVHFTNVTIQNTVGGAWVAPGGMASGLDCGTKYAHAMASGTAFDAWTAVP